jgi:hypothetical protein
VLSAFFEKLCSGQGCGFGSTSGSALIRVVGSRFRREKIPTKIEKSKEFSCFGVLAVLF